MRISSSLTMPTMGIGKIGGNQQSKSQSKTIGAFDSLSISGIGKGKSKTNSILESLSNQKQSVLENKNDLINRTTESGKSLESVQDLLDAYDDQLKSIDEQISQITVEEQKKALGGDKKEVKTASQPPITKEEIANQNLSKLVSMDLSISQSELISSIKDRVEGEAHVLETEIKLDGVATPGKKEELADLTSKVNTLSNQIGESINDTVKDLSNNIESNTQTDKVDKEMESNKSVETNYKIENYKNMQENISKNPTSSILDTQA